MTHIDAVKKVNKYQRAILDYLFNNVDEWWGSDRLYTYADLQKATGYDRKRLHREITRLRHIGYVDYMTAIDEDGYAHGSGFCIAYKKRSEVDGLLQFERHHQKKGKKV